MFFNSGTGYINSILELAYTFTCFSDDHYLLLDIEVNLITLVKIASGQD